MVGDENGYRAGSRWAAYSQGCAPGRDSRRLLRRCDRPSLSSIALVGSRFLGEVFQHMATMSATTMMARTVAEIRMKVVVVNDSVSTTEVDVVEVAVPRPLVASVTLATVVVVASVVLVFSASRLCESRDRSDADETEAAEAWSDSLTLDAPPSNEDVYAASGVGRGIVSRLAGPMEVLLEDHEVASARLPRTSVRQKGGDVPVSARTG